MGFDGCFRAIGFECTHTFFAMPMNMAFYMYYSYLFPNLLEYYGEEFLLYVPAVMTAIGFCQPLIGKVIQLPRTRKRVHHVISGICVISVLLALAGIVVSEPELYDIIRSKLDHNQNLVLFFGVFVLTCGLNGLAASCNPRLCLNSTNMAVTLIYYVIFLNAGSILGLIPGLFVDAGVYTFAFSCVLGVILLMGLGLNVLSPRLAPPPIKYYQDVQAAIRWKYVITLLAFYGLAYGATVPIQYLGVVYFMESAPEGWNGRAVGNGVLIIQQFLALCVGMIELIIQRDVERKRYFKTLCTVGVLTALPMGVFWWPGIVDYWYVGMAAILLSSGCVGTTLVMPYIYIVRCLREYPQYFGVALGLHNVARVLADLTFQIGLMIMSIWVTKTTFICFGLAFGTIFTLLSLVVVDAISVDFK